MIEIVNTKHNVILNDFFFLSLAFFCFLHIKGCRGHSEAPFGVFMALLLAEHVALNDLNVVESESRVVCVQTHTEALAREKLKHLLIGGSIFKSELDRLENSAVLIVVDKVSVLEIGNDTKGYRF